PSMWDTIKKFLHDPEEEQPERCEVSPATFSLGLAFFSISKSKRLTSLRLCGVLQEWEIPQARSGTDLKPVRRPDIVPRFGPMKTPLHPPSSSDHPPEDEKEEDDENIEEDENPGLSP
ncbi:hypothetical protein Tco_0044986, partial [Tanacetum coccineum]